MSVFFGAIADDFTGATDLASMLARAGVPVNLRIGVPETAAGGSAFEVIALKIRTAPLEDAVAEARAALRWLRAGGAQRIFWKYCSTFDSTSQGNIGPVAEALMADLGVGQTVYVPGFPENGRRVFMGHLFVGEDLLSDSSMRDHPLTPMRQSQLSKVLRPQVRREVGQITAATLQQGPAALAAALEGLRRKTVAHVILDTVSDQDLSTIASVVAPMNLITGGSPLAQLLPAQYAQSGAYVPDAAPAAPVAVAAGQLVLSGSCSAMTRAQVSAYLRQAQGYRLDPMDLVREGVGAAKDWLRAKDPEAPKIIYATAEPASVTAAQEALGVARAGILVEDALAELACVARDCGIGRIVVAGGETSGAVTRALDVSQLQIGPEIAPGVPWTHTQSAGIALALALKSGNFGGEDFFAAAFEAPQT